MEAAAKRALRAETGASTPVADAAAAEKLAGVRIPPPHALARIMSSSEGQRRRPLSSEALLGCSPLERLLHNSIPNITRHVLLFTAFVAISLLLEAERLGCVPTLLHLARAAESPSIQLTLWACQVPN